MHPGILALLVLEEWSLLLAVTDSVTLSFSQ